MDDHDTGYRLLFSHPEMVRDLLTGFVPQDWVAELDMSTLEKVNGSYVTDDLRSRCDDVIWRVRWGEDWIYIYLLLEFQSTVDPWMAVRIMAYIALLYQDLVRTGQLEPPGLLPPVLPVVFYNGKPRWLASTGMDELIHPGPATLRPYRPAMRFLLLDEGAYKTHELEPLRNLVAALFRLENSRSPEDIQRVLTHLIDWLATPDQAPLRRSLAEWLRRVLLPRRLPRARLPQVTDLQEAHSMLAESVREWNKEFIEEGLRKGLAQGLEQGMEHGLEQGRAEEARHLLRRLLAHRFGPLTANALALIEGADLDTLETWSLRVLDARRPEDVFLP